jgi:hypothetical protein
MRVLVDECLDWRLKREFQSHTAATVGEMGWGGTKNGALLALAQTQFDVSRQTRTSSTNRMS